MFRTPNGERIVVESHTPRQGEAFDWLRSSAVSNALNFVPVEDRRGVARTHEKPGLPGVVGVAWIQAEFTVEGTTKPFEVCQFDNDHWVAVGKMPGADVTIESRGIPPEAVELERMTYPPPDPPRQS
jgi:hypothetical protein